MRPDGRIVWTIANMTFCVTRRATRIGSLLMIDLDGFRKIDDTHGHATGDASWRRWRGACARAAAHDDLLARLGGVEFAVLHRATADARAQ